MFKSLLFIALVLIPTSLQAQEWTKLFDGKTLDGWVQRGGKAIYTVEDGAIVGRTVPNTGNSFLCTEKDYGDFVLELEFKVHPQLNSGVQIRSLSKKEVKNGRVHGYQVEIDPSDRAYTGGIYDEARRGWLYPLKKDNKARFAFKQKEWNKFKIVAKGDSIRTWLNGVPAADLEDDMTAEGFIALQVHGVGGRKDPLDVSWRNIRIRDANDADLKKKDKSEGAPSILSDNSKVEKIADGFRFVEGPATGPDGRLYFSDIPNNRIHVYDPATKQMDIFRENTGAANGLHWTPNDALICCEGGNRQVTWQLADGQKKVLANKYQDKKLNSPNDITLDEHGGLYFTDPRYGDRSNMEMDIEGVYYLNRGRKISRVVDDIPRPNGIVLTPDFKNLYVACTQSAQIYKFDVKGTGKIANKRVFASIGSDGMTIDEYGNLYCTWDGAVQVFNPDGEKIESIKIPENPANVTFGGPDNSTLFVTARTGLYAVETGVRGSQAFANPK